MSFGIVKQVLVIDHDLISREALKGIIESLQDYHVIGTASSIEEAAEQMEILFPDVVTIDSDIGSSEDFKRRLADFSIPSLVISKFTRKAQTYALKALEFGANDYILKPDVVTPAAMLSLKDEIHKKLTACELASSLNKTSVQAPKGTLMPKVQRVSTDTEKPHLAENPQDCKVIAIGSSTGGTVVLTELLKDLPVTTPPIVIVQHMPEGFTGEFARNLDRVCKMEVKQAEDGMELKRGQIVIAPGDYHMEVHNEGYKYLVKLNQEAPVCFSRPSVDVMFNSIAKSVRKKALAFILTGMGRDGADGMLNLKNSGSYNIAQNEASCLVYGMPKIAIEKGGTHEDHDIEGIRNVLLRFSKV
jgi:two-component system chemotaxis response regulator CheB